MTYKEYSEKRDALIDQAHTMIENGEDAAEVVAQVTELDKQYQAQVENQQNLESLRGQAVKINIQNTTTAPVVNDNVVSTMSVPMNGVAPAVEKITAENAWESQIYADAFAKTLQGKKLTQDEQDVYNLVNDAEEYVHRTTEEGLQLVIPHTVSESIWREIEDLHPFVKDIRKSYVKGFLTVPKEGTSTKAKWYQEDVETEQGKDTVASVSFGAFELARAITLSWKFKAMSTSQFLAYLSARMAEAMADGFTAGFIHGAGYDKDSETAGEPEGIVTFMKEDQIVEWAKEDDVPKLEDVLMARSKIKSGYRPAVYANSFTVWNVLSAIKDANGRPLFMESLSKEEGVGRILGCVVKEEAEMADNEILFSDASRAYQANINQQVSMTTEDHARKRETDYCGYAIADGKIISDRASSLLRKKA